MSGVLRRKAIEALNGMISAFTKTIFSLSVGD